MLTIDIWSYFWIKPKPESWFRTGWEQTYLQFLGTQSWEGLLDELISMWGPRDSEEWNYLCKVSWSPWQSRTRNPRFWCLFNLLNLYCDAFWKKKEKMEFLLPKGWELYIFSPLLWFWERLWNSSFSLKIAFLRDWVPFGIQELGEVVSLRAASILKFGMWLSLPMAGSSGTTWKCLQSCDICALFLGREPTDLMWVSPDSGEDKNYWGWGSWSWVGGWLALEPIIIPSTWFGFILCNAVHTTDLICFLQ